MKKQIKFLIVFLILILTTGCTTYLKDKEGKTIIDEKTGQSLAENILCRPEDEEIIKLYNENGFDFSSIPNCVCSEKKEIENTNNYVVKEQDEKEIKEDSTKEQSKTETKDSSTTEKEQNEKTEEENNNVEEKCEELSITSGKYDGLWTTIFVKPLAWVILFFGKLTGNFGMGLIITSILIRLVLYPLTKKSSEQTEKMKLIQPELDKLEKKYANKDQNDHEVMMAKTQEQMAIYKMNNINPISGCLPSLLQLPILMAFLDAINRVPAIFEESFLGFHLGTTPKMGIENGNWLYIILTILVAVTTFYSFAKAQNSTGGNQETIKQTKMMMNIFTIMIIVMSIFMSSALNIYWVVSNIFTLGQNYLVKRSIKK